MKLHLSIIQILISLVMINAFELKAEEWTEKKLSTSSEITYIQLIWTDDHSIIYTLKTGGVYISRFLGNGIPLYSQGMSSFEPFLKKVNSIYASQDTNVILLATDSGVVKYSNKTWTIVAKVDSEPIINIIWSGNKNIYAISSQTFLVSHDQGYSWNKVVLSSSVNPSITKKLNICSIDGYRKQIFLGSKQDSDSNTFYGILHSTDTGKTWKIITTTSDTCLKSLRSIGIVFNDLDSIPYLFCGTSTGLWSNNNSQKKFQPLWTNELKGPINFIVSWKNYSSLFYNLVAIASDSILYLKYMNNANYAPPFRACVNSLNFSGLRYGGATKSGYVSFSFATNIINSTTTKSSPVSIKNYFIYNAKGQVIIKHNDVVPTLLGSHLQDIQCNGMFLVQSKINQVNKIISMK